MFTTELQLKPAGGSKLELTAMLKYVAVNAVPVIVPRGFITDLASIPWLFQFAFPVIDDHMPAAVLHDWLYFKQGKSLGYHYSRKDCDELFLEAMEACKVNYFTRHAMYYAVRLFGQMAWGDDK